MSILSEGAGGPVPGPGGLRAVPALWAAALGDLWHRWRGGPVAEDAVRAPRQVEAMIALALIVAVALIGWFADAAVAHAARQLPASANHVFQAITSLGKSGWIFALAALVAFGALALAGAGRGRRQTALRLLAARAAFVIAVNAVSGILSQVVKHLVGRARPQFLDMVGPFHFDVFAIKASFASFPSGHTVTAFATAVAVAWFVPRWRWPLLLVALAVAVSRVAIGAHYPSDVLAGAILGSATSYFMARAWARRRIAFEPAGRTGFRLRGDGLATRLLFHREPART